MNYLFTMHLLSPIYLMHEILKPSQNKCNVVWEERSYQRVCLVYSDFM